MFFGFAAKAAPTSGGEVESRLKPLLLSVALGQYANGPDELPRGEANVFQTGKTGSAGNAGNAAPALAARSLPAILPLLLDSSGPEPVALIESNFNYSVTSEDDNATRPATAQITRLNNLGADKRPVVVVMPGWGGVGDVPAARDGTAMMFASNGYIGINVGFHQTIGTWYSDLAESVKAALDVLCTHSYAECRSVAITGISYGGTQTHPVVRYLRALGVFDGSGGANAGRKVLAFLGQDSGYTRHWDQLSPNADAATYSIAMIENLGDGAFPVDSCADGNCGARNRGNYHKTAAGSQYVLSYCPAGGFHGARTYADWDKWVLSAVKTMLHNHRGVVKFSGYVEPLLAPTNACVSP